MKYGVNPDIAVFAKALGNGYPMAAVIGTEKVMKEAQDSFISSTSWTEKVGTIAALATIRKYLKNNVAYKLVLLGDKMQEGLRHLAGELRVPLEVMGISPLTHFVFRHSESQAIKTLYVQEMLKRGYLATNAYYSSYAHTTDDVVGYLMQAGDVFEIIQKAIKDDNITSLLHGPVAHAGFQRLT